MTSEPAGAPERGGLTRIQLLSKVGELAGILEYDAVLAAVARLSIPELADWCIVDVVEDGKALRAEVAYRDPARAAIAEEVARLRRSAGRRDLPTWEALLARRSLLVPEYTEEVALEHAWSPAYVALARELRVRSVLAVPLVVRDAVVAVSTFVTTSESGRRYGSEELALAEELARRAAAVENARLHEELERSERRFRVALADTHVSVFEKDRDLEFRWVYNPMFGHDPAKVIGKGDHRRTGSRRVRRGEAAPSSREGRADPGGDPGAARGRGAPLLAHVEPLRGPAGDIVGLTGAVADVTEQKRVQEALADALAFRERMLGVLGHDLRSPLSAVAVGLSLLRRRADLTEDAREQVARIDRAAKRMLEMIETLLDFSASRFKGTLPSRR